MLAGDCEGRQPLGTTCCVLGSGPALVVQKWTRCSPCLGAAHKPVEETGTERIIQENPSVMTRWVMVHVAVLGEGTEDIGFLEETAWDEP